MNVSVQNNRPPDAFLLNDMEQAEAGRLRRLWQSLIRALRHSAATTFGVVLVFLIFLAALIGPPLSPYQSEDMILTERLQAPSLTHPFGTDQFGRDLLTRMLQGARVSLVVGGGGTLLALLVGVFLGAVAGYIGGWLDEVIMRLIDIVIAFPYIVLAIVLAWLVGPGVGNLILVIGMLRTPHFARITRGSVLAIREREYIEAARALGQRESIILLRHVLPNCISPIVVYASLSVATAISAEAALSFLGLGIRPPQPSWGTMLSEGQRFMFDAPWIATFPGIAISLTILGYNLLGDGLRDALDPRSQRR